MTALLDFVPEQSGYTVAHPNQVVSIELDGGAPRLRSDILRANSTVGVSWLLDRVEYTLFMKFMRQDTERGALPFLVDLVTDFFQLARHRVTLVPGSLRTSQVTGLTYRVAADLRVEQLDCFTATHRFESPNEVFFFGEPALHFDELFQTGDQVQILGAQLDNGTGPAIDLDGIYNVSPLSDRRIVLTNPAAINPDWSLLASYPDGIAGGIVNVSLINSPR